VFYEQKFAPHPDLSILLFWKTGRILQVDRVDDLASRHIQRTIAKAEFALTVVPRDLALGQLIPGAVPNYPLARDPASAETFLAKQGGFQRIGDYPIRGGEIHLFHRDSKS
jgi:hypothetical protein